MDRRDSALGWPAVAVGAAKPDPAGAALPRTPRVWMERAALPAGWAVAVCAMAPQILSADAGQRGGPSLLLAGALAWWAAAVAVIRSDLRDYIIPDGASVATGLLGVAVAAGVPALSGEAWSGAGAGAAGAMASAVAAFALFWIVRALFAMRGREALGFGDVKLAAALATWLSAGEAATALELAAFGAIAVLVAGHRRRPGAALSETAVPFGAFMAPAAWLVVVLGPASGAVAGLAPW